jgi:hypothetical protein
LEPKRKQEAKTKNCIFEAVFPIKNIDKCSFEIPKIRVTGKKSGYIMTDAPPLKMERHFIREKARH